MLLLIAYLAAFDIVLRFISGAWPHTMLLEYPASHPLESIALTSCLYIFIKAMKKWKMKVIATWAEDNALKVTSAIEVDGSKSPFGHEPFKDVYMVQLEDPQGKRLCAWVALNGKGFPLDVLRAIWVPCESFPAKS